ncbi:MULTISPECIES: threonine--tRNA ligase [Methanoculleus]|uniref:Threonine--tRNA ligase n=2 Tax=Methanoculleus TaxID=45989 RepID=SYT_METMJ|nr:MULTISPECIES: threonine--tRNA ligase [Methanoculleus]A3CTJ9.1 RecName: Full=Threonine--tRNA ligase; AltName: Full=Threonyl-tRNA synthetase; Short=ThrRS [Methanoculleus marisnigri JR1]ABN56699.1 threonyl-tRNA synthetase / Ser-tRNA(Thr) hydrolase [Methanoculleus marisnigri JR1]UYU18134.1 threonine--tRNA ligase [Methanoculleus submarinus]
MRLLLIHSDHIEYEARKKTKVAEEDAVQKDALDEALAVFCAVESVDEENIEDAVRQAADEIVATARQLGTTNIMIYPYAHLSSDLASPGAAVSVLKGIEGALVGTDGFVVKRAPFGWYKAFSLSCKGHPLSELSRTILPGEGAAAPKKEIEHEFFVITPEGDRKNAADYAKEETPFAALIRKELGYPGPEGAEPVHVDLMRAKELVEYEPRADVGNHRWMPRGKLIRDLLSDYVLTQVLDYGGMPVETPVMYDLGDAAIAEHAAKFGERQYRFKSGNRDMMLRFAACFGMFSIMHDMHISPNTLPMKLYELSTYSFRHEQKGEVIGLKRLRAFTMPDMHTLCRDMDGALTAFEEQLAIGWKTGEDLETPLVGVFRCTRDFFEQYELWVKGIVAKSGVPMLIEVLSERTHYWIAKVDLAAIDAQGRPIENPTVQIDVESADRFDIKYYAPDGTEVHPPILHCSPTGSIERVICAMLEGTAAQEVPSFPTWLAPTQVRLVPVAERHICFAEEIDTRLNAAGIRADVDDRDESVNKKIREAGMDWVPYVAVIGDQEAETGRLMVTIRKLSEKKKPFKESMTESELVQAVKLETAGKPFRPLYTPRLLSRKPRFI